MNISEYNEDLPSKWTDTLSKITGLVFLLCKEDKYYAGQEMESPLCRLLQENPAGKVFCEQDCTLPVVQAIKKDKPVYFKCYASLDNVAIPIYHNGIQDGRCVILGGRIVASYEDMVGYRGVAEKLGCEQDRIIEIVKGISIKDIDDFKVSMESIRTATGYLLQNMDRDRNIEDKITKLNTIIKVVISMSTITDSRDFYTTILNTLGVLFNVKTAMFLIRESGGDKFMLADVFGEGREKLSELETGWAGGLIREASVRNDVVSSTDLFDILKSGFPNGFTSVRIFPISVGNRVEGLIVILNTHILPEDEDLLRSFCRSVSLSFENRLLISRRETFMRKGLSLLEAFYSIAGYMDSSELFDVIIKMAADMVEAEQGSLMLLDKERHALEVMATRGLNPAILNYVRINPGEGIAGGVLERGTPLVVSNIEEDLRVSRPNRARYKTKSFISLPLKIKEKNIGVLNLSDKIDGTDFSGNDLKLLEPVALYSAVAIERRIYYQSSISLRKISITDPLTGLLNRRYFEERISEEMERSKRHGQPFSLIILDIDNFKDFNDTYGHLAGDDALKNTGHMIRRCIRIIDIAARYGGEEFSIILPTTDKEDARLIGERIREEIEKMSFAIKDIGKVVRLTVSLGIASYPVDASTVEELINNADRALYKAKDLGKNRVVLFGDF